jgi:ribosomal protein L12E/L44/L45/RPP1/RPP2
LNGFEGIIKQLEAQKTAIEHALAALREVGVTVAPAPSAAPMSATERRSEGQRKRWAAKREAAQTKKRPGRPRKV